MDLDLKLAQIYIHAKNELQLQFAEALKKGNFEKAQGIKDKVGQIVAELKTINQQRSSIVIPEEYIGGYIKIESYKGNIIDPLPHTENITQRVQNIDNFVQKMSPPHKEAIKALIDTSVGYVNVSLDGITRNFNLAIGEAQTERIRNSLAIDMVAGDSAQKSKQRTIDILKENGADFIRDRAGRRWDLSRYAETVIRTEKARAYNTATINRGIELGYTKFIIREQSSCCDICAAHNGKTIDITEGVVDLPPYHPNCRGYLEPYDEFDEEFDQQWNAPQTVTDPTYWDDKVKDGYLLDAFYAEDKGLSDDEVDTFMKYVSSGHIKINRDLNEGNYNAKAEIIANALNKFDTFKGTVYRGEALTQPQLDNLINDLKTGIYTKRSFMSTSLEGRIARSFSTPSDDKTSVYYIINGKSGKYIGNSKEKEILYNRGTKFKVDKVEYQGNGYLVYLTEL